mgnify:CR=1 FL=1
MVAFVPVIVWLAGAGKTVYQISKTPAGKKVIERILATGGRLLKGKPKGSKPITITAQNVAKVLKDVKAGKGPVGGGRPKGPSRTKPKDGKGPGVGRGNKTRTQEKPGGPASTPKVTKPKPNSGKGGPASKPKVTEPKPNSGKGGPASKPIASKPKPNSGKGGPASKPIASKPKPNSGKGGPASKPIASKPKPNSGKGGPASKPKVTKPKPNSGKGGPASKPIASKPKPNSGKGGPASKPNPFGKKTPAQKAAEAAKLKRQAEAMKKPNRSSNSGRFDKKGDKTTNVPRTGPKGPTKGYNSPKNKKGRDILNNPKRLGLTRVDNLIQDELDIVPFDNSDQKIKIKPRVKTAEPKVTKKKKPKSDFGNSGKGGGGPARTRPPLKKDIPTVKARPGPIKVRPKESDQPKKKMTFGEKFNLERGLNAPTFEFNGKQYTTRYKEESIEKHKKKFKVKGKYPKAKKR